jgi:hypothetical protein
VISTDALSSVTSVDRKIKELSTNDKCCLILELHGIKVDAGRISDDGDILVKTPILVKSLFQMNMSKFGK